MQVLTFNEVEQVSGAADWGQVGAGIGAVSLGILIASNPVGWVGFGAAAASSFLGGAAIGQGIQKP